MNETTYIYIVHSDINENNIYAEFPDEPSAIDYARRNASELTYVDKVEVQLDEDGEILDEFGSETIWVYSDEEAPTESEEDYWDMLAAEYEDQEANKHDLGDTTWFEGLDTDDLVETLEENETEVECKECFDIFPKDQCVKVAFGYICPTCSKCEVADDEIFKIDFPEYEKFPSENEMIPGEPNPEPMPDMSPNPDPMPETEETENDSISDPEEAVPFLVKDEEEAIAGYEEVAEVIQDSDIENKEEILDTLDHIKEEEKEHIEELQDLEVDTNTKDENDPISNPEEIETPEDDTAELEELFDVGLNVGIDGGENNNVSVLSSHEPEKEGEEELKELFDANVSLSLDGGTGNDVSVLSPLGGVGLGEDYIIDTTETFSYDELYKAIVTEGDIVTLMIDSQTDNDGNTIDQSWEICDADGVFSVVEHFYNIEKDEVEEGDFVFESDDFDTFYAALARKNPEVFIGKETITEHINEEHPAIESDQELEGTDNAVVKCKVADVVTHSEDEKPVDCKGEKKPLEKPLTEANSVVKDLEYAATSTDLEKARAELKKLYGEEVLKEDESLPQIFTLYKDLMDTTAAEIEARRNLAVKQNRCRICGGELENLKCPYCGTKHQADGSDRDLGTPRANVKLDFLKNRTSGQSYDLADDFLNFYAVVHQMRQDRQLDTDAPGWMEDPQADRRDKIIKFADGESQRQLQAEIAKQRAEIQKTQTQATAEVAKAVAPLMASATKPTAQSAKSLTEATHAKFAKPEGDRKAAYNNALKYAKQDKVPYIYGYSGTNGKFFALDQPIKGGDDMMAKEKSFRSQYKNCKVMYVAYPDKNFMEAYQKFTPAEMEEYGIDEEGCSVDGYDEFVRCTWCEDIYTKDDCGFEADLGWLCDRCQMAISSRGERLSMVINPTEDDFKRVMTEDIPMTSDELMNKYGTDDVDLINAGKEPEERVSLQEEAPEYDLTEVSELLKEIRGSDKKKSIHMR